LLAAFHSTFGLCEIFTVNTGTEMHELGEVKGSWLLMPICASINVWVSHSNLLSNKRWNKPALK